MMSPIARCARAALACLFVGHFAAGAEAQIYTPAIVYAATGQDGGDCRPDGTCAHLELGCQDSGLCEPAGGFLEQCRDPAHDPAAMVGILCDSNLTECVNDTCVPAGSEDQPCRTSAWSWLEYGSCNSGLTCATDGICRPPGHKNQQCFVWYWEDTCAKDEWLDCKNEVCVEVGGEGQPCAQGGYSLTSGYDYVCQDDLVCAGGVCLPYDKLPKNSEYYGGLGEPCVSGECTYTYQEEPFPWEIAECLTQSWGSRFCFDLQPRQVELLCHFDVCTHPGDVGGPGQPALNGTTCDEGKYLFNDGGICKEHWKVSTWGNPRTRRTGPQAFGALNYSASHVSLQPELNGHEMPSSLTRERDRCHIQGFARLPGNRFIITANSRDVGINDSEPSRKRNRWEWVKTIAAVLSPDVHTVAAGAVYAALGAPALNDCYSDESGGANLFYGSFPSGNGRTLWGSTDSGSSDGVRGGFLLTAGIDHWHPGGVQAVGDYVYVGVDGDKSAHAVLNILHHRPEFNDDRQFTTVESIYTPGSNASAVAAVQLPEGPILVVVGDLSTSGNKTYYFYLINPDKTGSFTPVLVGTQKNPRWSFQTPVGPGHTVPVAFASITLFVDNVGDVYMMGIGNERDAPLCSGKDGLDFGGSDEGVRVLYKLGYEWDEEKQIPMNLALNGVGPHIDIQSNHASTCAGTGVYVTTAGDLVMYSMQHDVIDGKLHLYEYSGL